MKTNLTVKQPEGFPFLVCDQIGHVLAITQTAENAQLIAAAPDMLEALQSTLNWLCIEPRYMTETERVGSLARHISEIKNAIEKATETQD